jgi:hypothetical protein
VKGGIADGHVLMVRQVIEQAEQEAERDEEKKYKYGK